MHKYLAAAALLVPAAAHADNPKFEYGKHEEVEKVKGVEWNAIAEAGVVFTTGNSETTTITAGLKTSRKTGKNKLAFEGGITYAKSAVRILEDHDGDGMIGSEDEIVTQELVTAESLAGKLRYDRFLTGFNSLFVAALASRDLPAGKQSVVGGQIGYSRRLYKSKTAEAVAELGYDFARENLVTGPSVSIHSVRAFTGFKSELAAGTTVDGSIEALTNLNEEKQVTRMGEPAKFGDDTRVNGKFGFAAKIGKSLAVQTSIEVKYDHRPGPLVIKNLAKDFVPEAAATDTIMKLSLLYTIF